MSDDDRIGTVVLNTPFPRSGVVRELRFNAVSGGRPLRVGIFQQEGADCNLRLMQQIMLRDISTGVNEVRYPLRKTPVQYFNCIYMYMHA